MKTLALLSGGLDSTLAARVMMDLGIEVEGVHFHMPFYTKTPPGDSRSPAEKAAEALGIPLKIFNVADESLTLVRHPKHGYGKNINPCIDCKIFMLKRAKAYMADSGASFIVTGEVLGQRPMSQHKQALRQIEKESGMDDLLLRPLSAKVLPVTKPERDGWVDRERLLDISGRSRKAQIALAEQYGIHDYPTPAGGCLLTDPGFAKKMKDLMAHSANFTLNDIYLLKVGRHFRLSSEVKLVVGRNDEENQKIQALAQEGDILLKVSGIPGPLSILRGEASEEETEKAASITAHYSKAKDLQKVEVNLQSTDPKKAETLSVLPLVRKEVEALMMND